MAWFKCGGGGIPAALKSLMNAVLNKKWGTSGTYPPETWPETVNLMGPLEEKTVSGSVVAFADGADDVPLKSCAVTIAPTLDGVSSVDVVQTGKNLCDPSDIGNYSISGTDGTISANLNFLATYNTIPVGNNTVISVSCGDNCDVRGLYCYGVDGSFLGRPGALGETNQMTRTLVSGTTHIRVTFRIHGGSGHISPSDLTSAQIECGSSSTTYSPYVSTTHTANLGRTIYGGIPDVVNGTGTETNELVPFSDCTWAVVTSYQSNFNADNGIISLRFGKNAMATAGYAQTVDGVACNVFDNNNRSVWNNVSRLNEIGYTDGITVNLHYSDIGLSEWTSNSADTLAAWRSSQLYQTGVFSLVKATPEDFTFTPVPINSRLGDNTLWSDGDLSVVYRSSGTQTIIQPTLISKTIAENGTYTASDEGADGYDEVTVNIPTGYANIETVLSSNPLIEITGVSGTDVQRTMWTYTASANGKIVFHANTSVKTNTGANDGYFTVKKNDTVIATTYANTSTTTAFPIPDIDIESGDVVTIIGGFDNYHTSCWFDLYSTITILSSGSAPVLGLGLGNSGPVNEPEQEEEPDAAPEEIQEETTEEVDQNESDE